MGLRGRLNRLQTSLRGQLSSFELADGSRYWYDPDAAFPELFLFGAACLRAAGPPHARPEPPELVRALVKAKDRRAAFESLAPVPFFPYEYDAFVERGELVHRSMVAGRDVYGKPCEDLSD